MKQLNKMAERNNTTPEEFLSSSIEESLLREAERETPEFTGPGRPEDFLTPEERLDAIAEILAVIGLRALKEQQEKERLKGGNKNISEK